LSIGNLRTRRVVVTKDPPDMLVKVYSKLTLELNHRTKFKNSHVIGTRTRDMLELARKPKPVVMWKQFNNIRLMYTL
jgi:hypothetical protein